MLESEKNGIKWCNRLKREKHFINCNTFVQTNAFHSWPPLPHLHAPPLLLPLYFPALSPVFLTVSHPLHVVLTSPNLKYCVCRKPVPFQLNLQGSTNNRCSNNVWWINTWRDAQIAQDVELCHHFFFFQIKSYYIYIISCFTENKT